MAQGDSVNLSHSQDVVIQHENEESVSGAEILQAVFGKNADGSGALLVHVKGGASSGGGAGSATEAKQDAIIVELVKIVNNTKDRGLSIVSEIATSNGSIPAGNVAAAVLVTGEGVSINGIPVLDGFIHVYECKYGPNPAIPYTIPNGSQIIINYYLFTI